ncbi:MAG: hypothetical protein SAJ12_10480 [Jaaginema sp. PMC 1079.18]|nr:hypothetical protein [Jaaginema sp. PMC 1080.18]MEC4851427.1 hypothetical protein [Jaaginema sp. PMC 1079.18]MEC4866103.1 hypothetical protein [Jaaginema sp. PMC 1078.18]
MTQYTITSGKPSKCKGCGADILWAKTAAGKFTPLDLDAVTPHWATCPDAANFKKPKPQQLKLDM